MNSFVQHMAATATVSSLYGKNRRDQSFIQAEHKIDKYRILGLFSLLRLLPLLLLLLIHLRSPY